MRPTMERPVNPRLSARLIGDHGALANAIGLALAADDVRLIDYPANEDPDGFDVLVFIAPDAPADTIASTPVSDFSKQVGACLSAAFMALQSGAASIRVKGAGGSIVFVAPPAGSRRAFDAVTQGLRLMAKAAALELGPEKIRVNIVLPGSGESPLGRSCMPADIAQVVAFAAAPRSQFMTGADLVVDGGTLAR